MIPVPLSVRLQTDRVDRHVTNELRELRFRNVEMGGHASAEIALARPVGLTPEDFKRYSRVYVYGHGTTPVWEGRIESPTPEVGADGEVWRVTCVGGMAHLTDTTTPLIYVLRALDGGWQSSTFSSTDVKTGTFRVDETVGGNQSTGIWVAFPGGFSVTNGKRVAAVTTEIAKAGQKLALVDYQWDAGFTTASGDWKIQLLTEDGTVARSENPNTAGGSSSAAVIGSNWTSGQQYPFLMLRYLGAGGTVSDTDVAWVVFDEVVIRCTHYLADGTEVVSGYTSADATILASTVVKDLLGRLLSNTIDGTNAVVDTTSFAIGELAWPGGVNPRTVLDRLVELEPGYRWGVYASNTAGKYRFEWVTKPAEVRYEADLGAGISMPASAAEQYNSVRVFFADARGKPRSVVVTSTVAELDAAGLTRQATLDLPSGTEDDATRAGEEFLAEHATPPAQGRLTVATRIQDVISRRMVWPWEIKAGELIRVRPLSAEVGVLTATGRDGRAVFRIVSVDFDASSATATLELDAYTPGTSQVLSTAAPAGSRPGRNPLWR